jgi:hypothetical protein
MLAPAEAVAVRTPRAYGIALVVAAALVLAVAASATGTPPGDAVPAFWPYPATAVGALALALGVHASVTERVRPRSVAATTAIVGLATAATVPAVNYTLHSASAPYILVGITVLPAALGAATKRRRRRLALALGLCVVALGVVGGGVDANRPLRSFFAAHVALSVPGGVVGYVFTVGE